MQAVVGEIHHILHVFERDTLVFQLISLVGKTEGEGVDVVEVFTRNLDFHHVASLIGLHVGSKHKLSAYLVGRIAHTAVEFHTHTRDVVGINQTVVVDVTDCHIVEVTIATTQTGVVHVGSQVVFVHALVAVDVTLHHTFRSWTAIYIHFTTRTEVANGFVYIEFDVACCNTLAELHSLSFTILLPVECHGSRPVLAIGRERIRTRENRSIACIFTRNVFKTL